MKTNLKKFYAIVLLLVATFVMAQVKTISGTVKNSKGENVAAAIVTVKSTGNYVVTDLDGKFSIEVTEGDTLIIDDGSGGTPKEVLVGQESNLTIKLEPSSATGAEQLKEVVVTALGISREKKSLGYATQSVSGDDVSGLPIVNFADALSGEVSGLDIKSSGTIGGSSNIIVRGLSSITGNNQALIIVDGTPINNGTYNTADQTTGRGGYDYGNAASDINPNDIDKINVLKGAAATALYGSRGANGVIMITTKKGGKRNKGIGVEVNSSYTVGSVDKETLPKYQNKYGAGYWVGGYHDNFYYGDMDGDGIDDPIVLFDWDGSYGQEFDPSRLVYQWNSFYPELDTYLQPTPWKAAKYTPNDVWEKINTFENSISLTGSNENGSYRLGITNLITEGGLPNTTIKKNVISFNGEYKFSERLKSSTSLSYTYSSGKGRWGTGYDSNNPMQTFRQWWQTNVDMYEQKRAYELTGLNLSWDPTSITAIFGDNNFVPIYHDNFYWMRDNNYQTDKRNRYIGNVSLDYKINDWLNVLGRYAFDNYDEIREDRMAVGSTQPGNSAKGLGQYSLHKQNVSENNYDVIMSANKKLNDNISIDAMIGWNLRVNKRNSFIGTTNGGLNIPYLYTLSNSTNPLTSADMTQFDGTWLTDGEYIRASIGFYNTYFVEGSFRTDRSSTLPKENNRYNYWSVSGSAILSELYKKDWLKFWKIRANYATVGNAPGPFNVFNTYDLASSYDGIASASNPTTFNNPNLENEQQKSWEIGMEASVLKNRLSFDISYYNNTTEKLLTTTSISDASGASFGWFNAGDVVNKGIELSLNATPFKTENFSWRISVNWAKNENEVTKLYGDNQFFELASLQGGVSVGAWVGNPLGVIVGTDYVYNNGRRVVGANGQYLKNANQIIGDANPDWTGGVKNIFTYKNLSLSFLIDVQKGGDVFSLDTWYGYATGLYDFTAGTNDLGNPIRNTVADGGGIILDGVKQDGSENDIRVETSNFTNPWGYVRAPNKAHVYDAGFVKLRNVTISYQLPADFIKNTFIENFTLSIIGRNLWIIHKNVPYADPEAGLSAGNVQGYQSGAYPTFREIGASVKINF